MNDMRNKIIYQNQINIKSITHIFRFVAKRKKKTVIYFHENVFFFLTTKYMYQGKEEFLGSFFKDAVTLLPHDLYNQRACEQKAEEVLHV